MTVASQGNEASSEHAAGKDGTRPGERDVPGVAWPVIYTYPYNNNNNNNPYTRTE